MDQPDDHDRGLACDLAVLDALIARRRMLGWIGSAGALALMPGASLAQRHDDRCLPAPRETAGPFPADGTNRAAGATSNVLASRAIIRRDIRPSFVGSTRIAPGIPLDVTLTLVDARSCKPLAGHALYLWQSDAQGLYSLYSAPEESWLRGVQITDSKGQARFTSIVPGCYAGRYPHLHVQVYRGFVSEMGAAVDGHDALLTSQLIIPAAAAKAAYADARAYPGSAESFARFSIARDYVFRDNSADQIAAMTLDATGDARRGFTAKGRIALA